MYYLPHDFSTVSLPGVGGSINASNAISTEALEELNKSGKKWRTDSQGNLSHFDESALKSNQVQRDKRSNLINRGRNEHAEGKDAMKEIFGRKKSRMEAFKELKRREYASDLDVLSIPQSFAECGCKGSGKCSCPSCKAKAEDETYKEWSTDKRKKLLSGEVKGEFAGPNMSFPIASPEDVSAAWSSVGRAPNPRKTMANIIRIAKENDWVSGLPETVKQRLQDGKSGLPE